MESDRPRRDSTLIGIAGVHFVVAELSRRGVVALPTVKNTAAYDVIAVNREGTKHANIQVKTSSKRVGFFPMPAAEKIRTGRRDFYVLLRWIEKAEAYEIFLLTGRQARNAVEQAVANQRRNIRKGTRKKEFPAIHVGPGHEANARAWNKAWLNWKL